MIHVILVEDTLADRILFEAALVAVDVPTHLKMVATEEQLFKQLRTMSCPELQATILFLDMMLAGKSGVDVLRRLKQEIRYAKVRVVMLSGLSHHPLIEEAYREGADAYLQKAIDLDTFIVDLQETLGFFDAQIK